MTMTPVVLIADYETLKRLSSSVCREHSNRATGDSGANPVGATCQDDRHPRAQNETGAVGVRQEAELLGEHVARLEVRNQEDVGIAGDLRTMPFIFAASVLMALSNASGPSRMPPMICFRSAILHRAAASRVAGILELTVSTAARIATFGFFTPSALPDRSRSGRCGPCLPASARC